MTPPTALRSLIACIVHVTVRPFQQARGTVPVFSDVLILNGPGTCFMLCLAVYLNRVCLSHIFGSLKHL